MSVDIRNKLAIHAKRKTIQPKDMQLLRDLWKQIDHESSIGHPDAATQHAHGLAYNKEVRKRAVNLEKDKILARNLRQQGKPLTAYLRGSLKGVKEFFPAK